MVPQYLESFASFPEAETYARTHGGYVTTRNDVWHDNLPTGQETEEAS